MASSYELLMSLSDSEFDELRKIRDEKGFDAAVEFVTPKFASNSNGVVAELDRIDNFSNSKKEKPSEEELEKQELEQAKLINIAEEGKEAEFVPNPQIPPTVGVAPIINENILQDPALKANDIQDGMQAGQAVGAQIAMNRINDTKIQQFSNPSLSYTEALDLIRETYIKDLKKDVFDEMIEAHNKKSSEVTDSNSITGILKKYDLPVEEVDGISEIISKIKESDNFGSSRRKVVYVNSKENYSMSHERKVIVVNFDRDLVGTTLGAAGGAAVGAGTGGIVGGYAGSKLGSSTGEGIGKVLTTDLGNTWGKVKNSVANWFRDEGKEKVFKPKANKAGGISKGINNVTKKGSKALGKGLGGVGGALAGVAIGTGTGALLGGSIFGKKD